MLQLRWSKSSRKIGATERQVDRDIADGQIRVVEMDTRTEAEFNAIMARCYRHVQPIPIRTFDAIHLATALVTGEKELVATDRRMRDAARLFGLTFFPA